MTPCVSCGLAREGIQALRDRGVLPVMGKRRHRKLICVVAPDAPIGSFAG